MTLGLNSVPILIYIPNPNFFTFYFQDRVSLSPSSPAWGQTSCPPVSVSMLGLQVGVNTPSIYISTYEYSAFTHMHVLAVCMCAAVYVCVHQTCISGKEKLVILSLLRHHEVNTSSFGLCSDKACTNRQPSASRPLLVQWATEVCVPFFGRLCLYGKGERREWWNLGFWFMQKKKMRRWRTEVVK